MFETLDRERRRWYIAFTGSSLESVLVSVETGLGISLLPIITTKGRRVRRNISLGEATLWSFQFIHGKKLG